MDLLTGSSIEATNSDAIFHSVHLYGLREQNLSLAPYSSKLVRVTRPETITVKCAIHGWMQAFIRVDDHPFHSGQHSGWQLPHQKDSSWDLYTEDLARIFRFAGEGDNHTSGLRLPRDSLLLRLIQQEPDAQKYPPFSGLAVVCPDADCGNGLVTSRASFAARNRDGNLYSAAA